MAPKSSKQQRIDDGSDTRLARVQRVLSIGTTSDANLASIMRQFERMKPSRECVHFARHAKFDSIKHVMKVPLQEGGHFDWSMCHPGLLLTRIVSESFALQAAFGEALQRHPCAPDHPWHLMVGFDEHIPGNKLSLMPARKSMNLSFSFVELGGSCA